MLHSVGGCRAIDCTLQSMVGCTLQVSDWCRLDFATACMPHLTKALCSLRWDCGNVREGIQITGVAV